MKPLLASLLIVLGAGTSVLSTTTDQSQTESLKENDWNSGVAQTFTAGYLGYLKGVRMLVRAVDGPRDLTLELRHVDANNVPTGPLLASGTLPGGSLVVGLAKWYTVAFDIPYIQNVGEKLSFTLEIGPLSNPYGYLKFGQSTNNPYGGGLMYYPNTYGASRWTYDQAYLDFAFQTLVIPFPEMMIGIDNNHLLDLSIPESYTDCVYHVQCRTNLVTGDWRNFISVTGTGNAIQWSIPLSPATNQAFYRVVVEEQTP